MIKLPFSIDNKIEKNYAYKEQKDKKAENEMNQNENEKFCRLDIRNDNKICYKWKVDENFFENFRKALSRNKSYFNSDYISPVIEIPEVGLASMAIDYEIHSSGSGSICFRLYSQQRFLKDVHPIISIVTNKVKHDLKKPKLHCKNDLAIWDMDYQHGHEEDVYGYISKVSFKEILTPGNEIDLLNAKELVVVLDIMDSEESYYKQKNQQLPSLKQLCEKSLVKQLKPDNAITIFKVFDMYSCSQSAKAKSLHFISTNMQRIQELKFEDYNESDILEVLTQVVIYQNSLGDPLNFSWKYK